MYNYALGLSLSLKFKSKFVIDKSFYNSSENIFNETFKLDNFCIDNNIEISEKYGDLFFKYLRICKKLDLNSPFKLKLLKIFLSEIPDQIFLEKNFSYDKRLFEKDPKK